MNSWPHKNILTLSNFSREDYQMVLEFTDKFSSLNNKRNKKIPALEGYLITSLFYEASTRTRNSFELAAKRLSAEVQSFTPSSSSMAKGETHLDTALTYAAMGSDIIIIRHSSSHVPFEIAKKLTQKKYNTSILNAGDGLHSHPSQGLLDLYTLTKFFSPNELNPKILNKKNILIIDLFKTPIDFKIAISRVLFLTNIVNPEIILNAAIRIINDKIINITFRSIFKAEKSD